eukprot:TRINITY_DN52161_c0_g1_i1.p1 TRINITY_DN52161_c0_g1~~TRINITY_DN52161_c0_g1_i1.p1  ORF type:complete len:286 (+),score=95.72 TRINITY_DN52161_c0_g1_i1:88-858(+)
MMRGIAREEGFGALFKGTRAAVLRQALCGGIGVGLYGPVKSYVEATPLAQTPFLAKAVTGSATGVLGQLLAAPTDVVKVRLQADARLELVGGRVRYNGTLDAFRTIAQKEGFSAFYRGLVPSLQRAAFMYGTSIATYDTAKAQIVRRSNGRLDDASVAGHVSASLVSGLVAALVSTPFDTIKTRLINQSVLVSEKPYRGMIDCAVRSTRSEGVLSLYKGFTPTYLRLAPWQLVFFVAFERLSIMVTGQAFASAKGV